MCSIEKEVVTYFQYNKLIDKLVYKIENSEYKDNIKYVYGIDRGGLPISVHLSHYLNVKHICSEKDLIDILDSIYGNEIILIVDDICDTGKTFTDLNLKYSEHTSNIIFSSLYYKPHSKFKPKFYIQETINWIYFPWESINENPNREMYYHLINKERRLKNNYLERVIVLIEFLRKEIKQIFKILKGE